MAETLHIAERRTSLQIPLQTALLASAAGVLVAGPLIGFMGISFVATAALFLVTAPLLLIFSPVLFGAVCVLALAMLGFAEAAAMAVAGVSAVAWIFRPFSDLKRVPWYGGGASDDESIDSGEKQRMDWTGHIQ